MGVAILAASNVTVERVVFDRLALFVLDIEPYEATGGGIDIVFRDNHVGTYGLSQRLTPYFFAADGEPGSVVRGVSVTNNVVTGGVLATDVTIARRQAIVVTGNVSTVPASGPVMVFEHVDGLTVTGNVQPLRSGRIVQTRDCTDVTAQ
jgi:hypothetical protein